jgi:hypothetical protein
VRPLTAIALVGLLVACGGPARLSADAYFTAAAELTNAYNEETLALDETYQRDLSFEVKRLERILDDGEPDAEVRYAEGALTATKEHTTKLLAGVADSLTRYVDGLAELEPPEDLVELHTRNVTTLDLAATALPGLLDSVAGAGGFDQIQAALAGSVFADAQARIASDCRAWQAAAADRGVAVIFRCEA